MRPLSRTSTQSRGEVVPLPFEGLDEFVEIRQGDAVTVLGAPMSNKSNLMLNWSLRTGVPTIYGSFDTPITDMTARSLAILSGDSIDEVFRGMGSGKYAKYADECLTTWFTDDERCLEPDREGLTTLDDLAVAMEEFLGEPPRLIVLDNLSDTAHEVHHVALQQAFKQARNVAARLNAAVFCLHHVKRESDEEKDPSARPVMLNDGVGAGERDAAVVLGLWKPKYGGGQTLRVAQLKSKRRAANPAGGLYKDFELVQSHAWIGEEKTD